VFNREDTVPPLRGTVVPWVNLVRVAIIVRVKGSRPGTCGLLPLSLMSDSDWQQALEALPATPAKIPAFFFSHGSPMLAMDASLGGIMAHQGASGPLFKFLSSFGPTLLKKYQPKGILVFSAHWETSLERLGFCFVVSVPSRSLLTLPFSVTEYAENPLLMDYYGFPPELYQLKFKSRGESGLSRRVVELYKQVYCYVLISYNEGTYVQRQDTQRD
jgi:Catalytic LigB subunit of aromatic ring-opening dioxygenase